MVGDQLIQGLSHVAMLRDSDPVLLNVKNNERPREANRQLEGSPKMLEGKLSFDTMRKPTNQAKTQGRAVAAAAGEFLQQAGMK